MLGHEIYCAVLLFFADVSQCEECVVAGQVVRSDAQPSISVNLCGIQMEVFTHRVLLSPELVNLAAHIVLCETDSDAACSMSTPCTIPGNRLLHLPLQLLDLPLPFLMLELLFCASSHHGCSGHFIHLLWVVRHV